MGADDVPPRSQGQTATEAVAGCPSISSPILTHIQQIYLIGPSGSTAQSKRVKNSGGSWWWWWWWGAVTWVHVSLDPFK